MNQELAHQLVADLRSRKQRISMARYFASVNADHLLEMKESIIDSIVEVEKNMESLKTYENDLIVISVMIGVALGNKEREKSEEEIAQEG